MDLPQLSRQVHSGKKLNSHHQIFRLPILLTYPHCFFCFALFLFFFYTVISFSAHSGLLTLIAMWRCHEKCALIYRVSTIVCARKPHRTTHIANWRSLPHNQLKKTFSCKWKHAAIGKRGKSIHASHTANSHLSWANQIEADMQPAQTRENTVTHVSNAFDITFDQWTCTAMETIRKHLQNFL